MSRAVWLFVPGSRPERFAKAIASGAGQVILDLEDAVAPGDKESARSAVADALAQPGPRYWVRVNAAATSWHDADLAALAAAPGLAGVMLPKAEDANVLSDLESRLGKRRVVALVETAVGIDAARTLARHSAVAGLAFGSLDFAVDIAAEHEDDSLLLARSSLVLAARLGGLPAPVDGVTTAVDDEGRVAADAARARRLGFGGKLCIHPRQVAPIAAAFAPSEGQRDWARRVLDAGGAGSAVAVDGEMVDKPVLERARRILFDD